MQQHSSATYKHPQSYLFVFQLHSDRPAVIWIIFCTPMCPASLFRNACLPPKQKPDAVSAGTCTDQNNVATKDERHETRQHVDCRIANPCPE